MPDTNSSSAATALNAPMSNVPQGPADNQSVTLTPNPSNPVPTPPTITPTGTPSIPASTPARVVPPAPPAGVQSVWKSLVQGALYGLAGSAGAKHFGSGLAQGAGAVIQKQQQDVENAQRAATLQMESVKAGDDHVLALHQARAADLANQEAQEALDDHHAAVAAMNAQFGIGPSLQISADNSAHMHSQATGGLTTLASQNGGKVPPIVTTNSPAINGQGDHTINVYAPPTAAQLSQNDQGYFNFVNEARKISGDAPLSDQLWRTGGGTIVPNPAKPMASIEAQKTWQSQQVQRAYDTIVKVPLPTGNQGKDSAQSAFFHQQLASYKATPNPDKSVVAALSARNDAFDAEVGDAANIGSKMAAQKTTAVADAKNAAKPGVLNAPTDADYQKLGGQLANGDLTLADVRYALRNNPGGVANVVGYAKQANGNFDAPTWEGYASTAKSNSNVQFFGNVRSLVQSGGTLDQLSQAGSNISQNDFQVLNKTKNWAALQTGSGPIAGYAATALGVADDYAKVMGGSVGTDASRQMVLNAINPSLSPAQRQTAIAAIKNSVRSQADGRAGNNPYLHKQNADILSPWTPNQSSGPSPTVTARNSGPSIPQGARPVMRGNQIIGYTTDGKTMTPVGAQ